MEKNEKNCEIEIEGGKDKKDGHSLLFEKKWEGEASSMPGAGAVLFYYSEFESLNSATYVNYVESWTRMPKIIIL